ncbi:MAG: ArsR/SmtB family transcription factor [Phycisphaeraceae bacterium]
MPLSENKQLEAIVRGFANHHRIALLLLLAERPGLTLDGCAKGLDLNVKTASGHLRELSINGFVDKEADGRSVHHALTLRGQSAVAFIHAMRRGPHESAPPGH